MEIISKTYLSIYELAGYDNTKESWNALIEYHNDRFGNKKGYIKGEKIAIKVNLNGSGTDDDSNTGSNLSFINPVVLKCFLENLVINLEADPTDISVYDVTRIIPTVIIDECSSGILEGINFVDRKNAKADYNSKIEWSYDFESVDTYLPTVVTEATYLINLANLKGHSYGITLVGKNLFGSFINENQIRAPQQAGLHQFLNNSNMDEYSPIVDLLGHYEIYNKTFLYMFDALIVAPSEGIHITKENTIWKQSPFDGNYTSSLLFSQDALAIDSVGADLLVNEPTISEYNSVTATNEAAENYLHEASLLSKTPSGTKYQNNNKEELFNLGTHEHWNNSIEKLYSRNIGLDKGIELIYTNIN